MKKTLSDTLLLKARDQYLEQDREEKEREKLAKFKLRRDASIVLARLFVYDENYEGRSRHEIGIEVDELSQRIYESMSFSKGDSCECRYVWGEHRFIQRFDENGPRLVSTCPDCDMEFESWTIRDLVTLGAYTNKTPTHHRCPRRKIAEKADLESLRDDLLTGEVSNGTIEQYLSIIAGELRTIGNTLKNLHALMEYRG